MHGPTFMGNPLACSVALASIRLLENMDWQQKIAQIEHQLKMELDRCSDLDDIADVRVLGAIGVVELKSPVNMKVIQQAFVDAGVWIRPFGKLIYLMPPYIIDEQDLNKLTTAIFKTINDGKHL
jgi:adenosylmethionine-8-amino-7-oxononanoate aminotransferase